MSIKIFEKIIKKVNNLNKSITIIWINWVDGSWKSIFAKELKLFFENNWKKVILASVDDFHNPKEIRYKKWKESPVGFYMDSYNYDLLKEKLLIPFYNWKWNYKTKVFDLEKDILIDDFEYIIEENTVLILEWIFIFRKELVKYFDLKIFLDVSFQETLNRNIKREKDIIHIWDKEKIIEKYKKRYMPWQKLYFKETDIKNISDIIIDNNDFQNRLITKI